MAWLTKEELLDAIASILWNKSLKIGDQVVHERFGKGKVVELNGDFPNTKATVFFPSAGQKQLLLKFAKLQLI